MNSVFKWEDWRRRSLSYLNDDETSTGAVGGGEVDARLVVGDIEALDGREGAVGQGEERSNCSLHVEQMARHYSSRLMWSC